MKLFVFFIGSVGGVSFLYLTYVIFREVRFLLLKYLMKDHLIFRFENMWLEPAEEKYSLFSVKNGITLFFLSLLIGFPFVLKNQNQISFAEAINLFFAYYIEGLHIFLSGTIKVAHSFWEWFKPERLY